MKIFNTGTQAYLMVVHDGVELREVFHTLSEAMDMASIWLEGEAPYKVYGLAGTEISGGTLIPAVTSP